jgi:tetratricopeptide (TPR) repeat protein
MSRLAAIPILIACLIAAFHSRAEDPHNVQTMAAEEAASRETLARRSLEVKGDVMMARGEYVEALHAYEHLWPQTASTLNKTGTAYLHLYAVDPALRNYELAVKLDPHYAAAWNNLGAIYHGRRDFAQAEKIYKKALKYDPHAAITYSNLGTTYFAEGKYKKGAKAYARALELDPDVFSPSRRNMIEEGSSREQRSATAFYLAEVYASAGKTSEALEALRKAFSEGFEDRKRLMEDKELASLRRTPEFQELMAGQHLQ